MIYAAFDLNTACFNYFTLLLLLQTKIMFFTYWNWFFSPIFFEKHSMYRLYLVAVFLCLETKYREIRDTKIYIRHLAHLLTISFLIVWKINFSSCGFRITLFHLVYSQFEGALEMLKFAIPWKLRIQFLSTYIYIYTRKSWISYGPNFCNWVIS